MILPSADAERQREAGWVFEDQVGGAGPGGPAKTLRRRHGQRRAPEEGGDLNTGLGWG